MVKTGKNRTCVKGGAPLEGGLECDGLVVCGEEWPRFRGPAGQGISQEKMLPTHWGLAENVVWKTRIPGEGWSSPIVWGDRVFLTPATDGGAACHVLALSRVDGHVIWDVTALHQKAGHKQPKNSYATPTPVTDGEAVYAAFHEGSIVVLTVEGRRLWQNRPALTPPRPFMVLARYISFRKTARPRSSPPTAVSGSPPTACLVLARHPWRWRTASY